MIYTVFHCSKCKQVFLEPKCNKCLSTLTNTLVDEPIKISYNPESGAIIQRIIEL